MKNNQIQVIQGDYLKGFHTKNIREEKRGSREECRVLS
jgi:hypothetical protein